MKTSTRGKTIKTIRRDVATAALAALALGCSTSLYAADRSTDAEQHKSTEGTPSPTEGVPATKHQSETVRNLGPDAEQSPGGMPMGEESKEGMPATKHQEETVRDLQKADKNGDGRIDDNEFKQYQESTGGGDRSGAGRGSSDTGGASGSGMGPDTGTSSGTNR